MKIATVGKGGSGKTTVVGTLTRILAENGIKVLAIDGDPNPNLALTLGIKRDATNDIKSIPTNVMALKKDADGNVFKLPDGTSKLMMTLSQDDLIDRYATEAPENIKLVIIGTPPEGSAGSGCMCASHRAVRGLITEMTDYGEHTITDMEAGLEHLKRGTARNVDMMLIVAEPYYRSLEAASRIWSLAAELKIPLVYVVANKVRNDADRQAIEEYCVKHGMPILGFVPNEEKFVEAERQALSPIDFAPDCAGTIAIRDMSKKIAAMKIPGIA